MANSVVRARVDEKVRAEAAAVLEAMGMTVSDAVRMLIVRIAREKTLPFEPLVPNHETMKAMTAARSGDTVKVGGSADLIASLNARN